MAELQPIYGFNHPQLNILPVEYRDVPGFPGYRLSNVGTLWTCRVRISRTRPEVVMCDKWATVNLPPSGKYAAIWMYAPGVRVRKYIHVLVLEVFVCPKPDPELEACHNNGIRRDNWAENLRWDTVKANSADRLNHGTFICGRRTPWVRFEEHQIREIRSRYAAGEKQLSIAKDFQITQGRVSAICRRREWKHLS